MVLLSNKQFVSLNSEFAFPSLCFFSQNIAHSTDPWTVVKLQFLFRYRRYQNFRRNLKIPTWLIGYNDWPVYTTYYYYFLFSLSIDWYLRTVHTRVTADVNISTQHTTPPKNLYPLITTHITQTWPIKMNGTTQFGNVQFWLTWAIHFTWLFSWKANLSSKSVKKSICITARVLFFFLITLLALFTTFMTTLLL